MGKLRKSISQVDNKFVEELRGDKGRSIMKEGLGAIGEKGSKGETGDEVSFGEVAMEKQSFGSGFVNI